MLEPNAVAADGSEVDGLVAALDALEVDAVVSETGGNLADFGLDKPKVSVEASLSGSPEPLTLLVGDKVPAENGLYAKLPAKPRIFTIAGYLEATFTKKPFELRDRDVLHVKRDDMRSLAVKGPEGDYSLDREASGEWIFKTPLATEAGRWAVDGILGAVEGLRMESVAAESATEPKDLKPFGLDKPVRSLTVQLSTGVLRTLEIGAIAADKKYYARDAAGGPVVVVAGALVDDLAKGMGNLRAKRLAELAAYEVEGFDVEADGVTRVYAKAAAKGKDDTEVQKWKRSAPDAKDLEPDKVQDALFKVGGMEALSFVDKPEGDAYYGLDKPALKLTVRKPGAKTPLVIEIGQKEGASYARRTGDVAILRLDPAKTDDLVKTLKQL
jgi:hypothetical protein